MVPRDQPNSSCSGSMNRPGTERKAAAPMILVDHLVEQLAGQLRHPPLALLQVGDLHHLAAHRQEPRLELAREDDRVVDDRDHPLDDQLLAGVRRLGRRGGRAWRRRRSGRTALGGLLLLRRIVGGRERRQGRQQRQGEQRREQLPHDGETSRQV
jgi:hypothetical protein